MKELSPALKLATSTPLRVTSYSTTATLSVEGVQRKLMLELLTLVADRFVGAVGAVVSLVVVDDWVSACTSKEASDTLPAASRALIW